VNLSDKINFSKQLRIVCSTDFQQVLKNKQKLGNRFFTIYMKPNTYSHPRLGLIVAKKAVRLAVKRNQIKRIVRESFRQNQKLFQGCDLLFMAYNTINTLEISELHTLLNQQWRKTSILYHKIANTCLCK
jgi:ribonuclease P protein component